MSYEKDVIEKMVDNIVEAMEENVVRMISATIIAGNICSGSESPLVLENQDKVVNLLEGQRNKYGQALSVAIQANLYVWSVGSEIREELFREDDLSIDGVVPIISSGGLEWFMLSKTDVVERQELKEFFGLIKALFIESSVSNKGKHEKYDEILNAIDNIIAVL